MLSFIECNCHKTNSDEDGKCDENGKCTCKSKYSGKKCRTCAPKFINYPDCDECQPGYFNYPICEGMKELVYMLLENINFCNLLLECRCVGDRAATKNCDKMTGKCNCKEPYSGHNCEDCADTYFGRGQSCESKY